MADVVTAFDRLGPAAPSPVEGEVTTASAVLAPLYDVDGEAHVVLTRRAAHLRSHRGEVSFPGGRREPGDPDLAATALREAHEETALDPGSVRLVGELDHLSTIMSRSFIVPFVGTLEQRPDLVANPAEVDRILHVSLAELLLDEVWREEMWWIGSVCRPMWFFELAGDTVWGATAAMLRQLLGFVTGTVGRGGMLHP